MQYRGQVDSKRACYLFIVTLRPRPKIVLTEYGLSCAQFAKVVISQR